MSNAQSTDVPYRSIFAAYDRLERELSSFLEGVPFESSHFEVWSPTLASIILEAGSQLDSLWKMATRYAGGQSRNATIIDHFENFGPPVANRWLVVWSDTGTRLRPFADWDNVAAFDKSNYVPLSWWQAYNDLKHDRWANKRKATLREAVNAVGALLIGIVQSEMLSAALLERSWLKSDYNPEYLITLLNGNESQAASTGSAIETTIFSYPLGSGASDFQKYVRIFYRCDRRFVNWLLAEYRIAP